MRLGTHLIVVAALAASLVYIVWRWGFTLDGPSMWLGAPLAVAETYALVMLCLLAFSCWRMARREVPAPLAGREVAVLVATFNEPEDVLRPTVVGALAIRNDIAPQVWVLDDGGRPWVRLMCEELSVRYLSRPAPRRDAKAGNINYALERVDAEFVVTLDADHVPRPELLERMLGHFADERVAVVQSPQHFYNRGFQHPRDHDDPLRNEQSIFFDAICRGKDRHNAAFWCGCPSVIRREAIASVGGVATDTVVEDAHTSMQLHAAGWRIVFHFEVMALGIAPEEIGAFLVQRGRWAKGSLQMLRRDPPMFKRGLSWSQRLEYTASCLHFLEGPQRLLGFLIPPIVLTSGIAPIDAGPLLYAALFIPQIVLVPLASRALTRGRYRLIEAERFAVARMTPYLKAMAALLGGRGGFQVTPKGGRSHQVSVMGALWLPIALASVTVVTVAYQTAAQILGLPGQLSPGAHAVTVVWAAANVALVVSVVAWARGVRHVRFSHRFPVAVQAGYTAGRGPADAPAHVEDISREGLAMRVSTPHAVGERLRIVLLLDDGPVEVSGAVVRAEAGHDPASWSIGVAFDALEPAVADTIIEWCFRHPFGPDRPVRVSELVEPRRVVAPAPVGTPEPSRA
ncbi:MAG TPA: glycosyltransferase [Miltoncostaeaceae bacterium]|nr:glycosyltransferase [Miltoncostaeaceae bacterium]